MVVKSHIRGHEVSWNDRLMRWEFKDGRVYETIPFEDVPEEWLDRCSGNGWKTYVGEDGDRYYEDGEFVSTGMRTCKRCGSFPIEEGHDSCIGELGSVVNACCGHGEREGYIQFDNDKIVRGFFL